MPRRDAQIVVLAEDKQQRAFVSRLLQGLGYHPRRVRFLAPPAEKSGGATFVLQKYPVEVREHRRKATFQKSLRLLVMIDADQRDVDKRLNELDARLQAGDQPKRGDDEGIAILVPDRNIETWIRWLGGEAVDDSTEYPKHKRREKQCADAVKRLLELIRGGKDFPEGCPPSLIAAIEELDRLKIEPSLFRFSVRTAHFSEDQEPQPGVDGPCDPCNRPDARQSGGCRTAPQQESVPP